MDTTQSKAIIERLFNDVMNRNNPEAIYDLLDPGFVNRSMPMPQPGPDGFKAVLENFTNAFPDMKIVLERLIGEGNMVVSSGHWTGTNSGSFMGMPATGKKVNVNYIDIWRIENGEAVDNWVQMDNIGLMQQLVLMPQPA